MFEALGDKLEGVVKRLKGNHKLTEANMKDALREVRLALLEADVNYKVVKDFISAVQEKALGEEVLKGVNPAQQFVKIVHDEMTTMMTGGDKAALHNNFAVKQGTLTIILLLGLQGAGKTTFAGKLANYLQKKGSKPILAACDVYRPAAIEQLKTVGKSLSIPVYARETDTPVNEIVAGAIAQAKESGRDLLIIDTAGRLHIDEVKMDELISLRENFKPDYTFLVVDAMTGQDAVNSALSFDKAVGIDGVCLTKMDGDSRGGAALSVRAVTGKPIVFVGTGEKADNLELFHPDRVAKRILGMGDVVSLVEKAQEVIDESEAMDMQEKLMSGRFSWNDFQKQLKTMRRMGSMKGLLSMIPGMGNMLKQVDGDVMERELKKVEVMIQSMTEAERENGDLLSKDGNRRLRVAKGCGRTLKEINDTVRQFDQMRAMMAQMGSSGGGMMGGLGSLFGGGNPLAGGMPGLGGGMPGGQLPPGVPMSKRMIRAQKEMLRQQQRELESRGTAGKKKKDRKKKRR